MTFGSSAISAEELAELIRAKFHGMLKHYLARDRRRISDPTERPGRRKNRTKAIKTILRHRAKELGLDYSPNYDKRRSKKCGQFLCDFIWWNDGSGKKGIELAVESEWNRDPREVVEDFKKLLVIKSPLKLMIYRVSRNTREEVRMRLEQSLREYRHHVEGESYVFCEFQPDWTCICCILHISESGHISALNLQELFQPRSAISLSASAP